MGQKRLTKGLRPWNDRIGAVMTFFNVFCDGRFRAQKPVQNYEKIPMEGLKQPSMGINLW